MIQRGAQLVRLRRGRCRHLVSEFAQTFNRAFDVLRSVRCRLAQADEHGAQAPRRVERRVAGRADRDLTAFGTFPRRDEKTGLSVFVPTARYMLALKLKALRVSDFEKGQQDMADVVHLLKVLELNEIEQAIAILAEFFPNSASDADKQRFVLKRLIAKETSTGTSTDAPRYPRTDS